MARHVLAHDPSAIGIVVGAGPDGQLPKPLQTMDPAILELVCAEVVEEGAQVRCCRWLPAARCRCSGAGQLGAACLIRLCVQTCMRRGHKCSTLLACCQEAFAEGLEQGGAVASWA